MKINAINVTSVNRVPVRKLNSVKYEQPIEQPIEQPCEGNANLSFGRSFPHTKALAATFGIAGFLGGILAIPFTGGLSSAAAYAGLCTIGGAAAGLAVDIKHPTK